MPINDISKNQCNIFTGKLDIEEFTKTYFGTFNSHRRIIFLISHCVNWAFLLINMDLSVPSFALLWFLHCTSHHHLSFALHALVLCAACELVMQNYGTVTQNQDIGSKTINTTIDSQL